MACFTYNRFVAGSSLTETGDYFLKREEGGRERERDRLQVHFPFSRIELSRGDVFRINILPSLLLNFGRQIFLS